MKQKVYIILFVLGILALNHPDVKALIKGLRGAFVEAPVNKAKQDFRQQAEQQAQKQAEERMKEIDAAIDKTSGRE